MVAGGPAVLGPPRAGSGPVSGLPWWLWAARLALVASVGFSVVFDDLPQFAGKGMGFRAPFYLLPLVVVPVVWWLRGRTAPYPAAVDLLTISPFLLDTLGNVFNFYNTYDSTDDVLHFLNWVLLGAAVALALLRTRLNPLSIWTMAWGIGGLAIIWWEAAEWLVQQLGTSGLELTYGDTIGDLVLSSTGGAVGAAVVLAISGLTTAGTG